MDQYRIEAAPGSASVSLGRTGNSGEPCGDSQLPGVGVDAGTSLVGSPLRRSGCGTGLTSSCGIPPKSAGLQVNSGKLCAMAVAAISTRELPTFDRMRAAMRRPCRTHGSVDRRRRRRSPLRPDAGGHAGSCRGALDWIFSATSSGRREARRACGRLPSVGTPR